jgi:hypothetical protein
MCTLDGPSVLIASGLALGSSSQRLVFTAGTTLYFSTESINRRRRKMTKAPAAVALVKRHLWLETRMMWNVRAAGTAPCSGARVLF